MTETNEAITEPQVLSAQAAQLEQQERLDLRDLQALLALLTEAEAELRQVTLRLLAEHPEVRLPLLAQLQERLQTPATRALLVRADRRDRQAILSRLEGLEGWVPEACLVEAATSRPALGR